MQATMVKTKHRLQEFLVVMSTIDPNDLNKQRMTCDFYKSTM